MATAPPASPGSQAGLRVANRRRVLDAVRSTGAVTQASIARETALAPSTVSSIVKELTACDLLVAAPEHGGRRGQRIRFSPGAGHLLGVDVGHRHVEVAVADLNLDLPARRRIDLPGEHGAEDVLRTVRETARELLEGLGIDPGRVLHAGLTLPAPVPTGGRSPRTRSILPGWAGTDVAAGAAAALGCPVVVENDANAGAVAEHALGAGRGVRDMAYLKVSHGVGAGLVLGDSLYRGAHGCAGEIGHFTLDEGAGLCRCGNRGCLETFVSASAVLDVVATSGQPLPGVSQVVDAALAGDPGCRRVVADTGGLLGGAVAQLCNLLDPELVVVGGDLARAGDMLLDPLLAVVRRRTPEGGTRVRAVPSLLGADAHLLGALVLARSRTPLPV
ncbi:ROK family transcriptional regulator [Kocuria sp.]|uniref:ROK family transcriptional regulator n=1 Tax=Kocuria sp. TaxID=1871328 RepID=UPI0026DB97FE|nr:ROK family transcriptional regulator [Kocuria sp.]MDO4919137.1 ROK family transcriptional regulator [Kocuria sp.]